MPSAHSTTSQWSSVKVHCNQIHQCMPLPSQAPSTLVPFSQVLPDYTHSNHLSSAPMYFSQVYVAQASSRPITLVHFGQLPAAHEYHSQVLLALVYSGQVSPTRGQSVMEQSGCFISVRLLHEERPPLRFLWHNMEHKCCHRSMNTKCFHLEQSAVCAVPHMQPKCMSRMSRMEIFWK